MATSEIRANQYKTIHIHKRGSDIDVAPRCAELQFGTNEQIEWVAVPSNLVFTLSFKGESPFERTDFDNEHNISGPPVVDPGENDRFYAYTLVVDQKTIDPGVIIWRRN